MTNSSKFQSADSSVASSHPSASGAAYEDISTRPSKASSWLWNKDLAPIPRNRRTWGTYNYAALWIAMSVNIPTYMLASAMIAGGMNWKQAIFTVFLGQRDCADSDAAQRACRRGIWHSISGFRAFFVRRAGCECSGSSARTGGLWLVRDSNVDRRRSDQYIARGGQPGLEPPVAVLSGFLALESGGNFTRH